MIKSPLRIKFANRFNRQRKAAPLEIKIALLEVIELFLEDPNNLYLRVHPLGEKYSGYLSFNVTEDWRALFKIHKSKRETIITFHFLGTHSQLYGN
jgi:addiction module RelE/StbE family toxin